MFNFNTTKKQNEPNLNTAIAGGGNTSQATQKTGAPANQDALINSRIEEIEAQRREFMKKMPDFDMKAELQNPQFAAYVVKNRLTIEEAYFLVHRDELIGMAVSEALSRMAARRDRIAENGAGKNNAVSVKKNPKEMSDKEIDAIIERVRNGEKITF